MSEGIKHDKDKVDRTLIDPEIYSELKEYLRVTRGDNKYKKDSFSDVVVILENLISKKMYIYAVVVAINTGNGSIEEILKIYGEGAVKYTRHNWKGVRPIDRYLAAAYRHMKVGINTDDFGVSHMAHFCWNMIAMRWFEKNAISTESDIADREVIAKEINDEKKRSSGEG